MSYQTKTLREKFGKEYYATRNYQTYLTRKFDTLARDLAHEDTTLSILDFGCGYGGLVNALWESGHRNIYGTDISHWAIEEGHRRFPHLKDRLQFYNRDLLRRECDMLLMIDVLEHMPQYEIEMVLKLARKGCLGKLVVRIPIAAVEGEPFVLPVSNNDPTHITCHTREWWDDTLAKAGFHRQGLFQLPSIYDSPGVLAANYG